MRAYFVYMLRCRGDVYYTGLTTDIARRYRLHLSGKGAKFTRSHPPEAIAAAWHCGEKTAAAKVEYAIKKSLTRGQKETLIAAPDTIGELLPQLADLPLEVVDITKIEV
ncbi:MAG: GIY-YIG nuclease family protein [Oscillospiraceae bacterium]|nr:GIY-YIG nuclease family protein [Oscillospiraceae bacterium]